MEDAKKQEWSKFSSKQSVGSGEIVFVNKMVVSPDTVYVVYFDPKRREYLRFVGIKGTSADERKRNHLTHIWGVPFRVENTMCLYQLRFFPYNDLFFFSYYNGNNVMITTSFCLFEFSITYLVSSVSFSYLYELHLFNGSSLITLLYIC